MYANDSAYFRHDIFSGIRPLRKSYRFENLANLFSHSIGVQTPDGA